MCIVATRVFESHAGNGGGVESLIEATNDPYGAITTSSFGLIECCSSVDPSNSSPQPESDGTLHTLHEVVRLSHHCHAPA